MIRLPLAGCWFYIIVLTICCSLIDIFVMVIFLVAAFTSPLLGDGPVAPTTMAMDQHQWGFLVGDATKNCGITIFCFKTGGYITYDVLSVHIDRFLRNTCGETSCANEFLKTKEEIHSS